jgi:hypothetical protein
MYKTNQAKKLAENNAGRSIDFGFPYGDVVVIGYSGDSDVIVKLNPSQNIGFGYEQLYEDDVILNDQQNPTIFTKLLYFSVTTLNKYDII